MDKAELYIWIIQIIVDSSERHVCVFCVMAVLSTALPSSAIVTDTGSIVLQMPRNRKRVTQKEKGIIEACPHMLQVKILHASKPLHVSYCS